VEDLHQGILEIFVEAHACGTQEYLGLTTVPGLTWVKLTGAWRKCCGRGQKGEKHMAKKPCKRCGDIWRYASSGGCVTCRKRESLERHYGKAA
jgi:hypothetical protein